MMNQNWGVYNQGSMNVPQRRVQQQYVQPNGGLGLTSNGDALGGDDAYSGPGVGMGGMNGGMNGGMGGMGGGMGGMNGGMNGGMGGMNGGMNGMHGGGMGGTSMGYMGGGGGPQGFGGGGMMGGSQGSMMGGFGGGGGMMGGNGGGSQGGGQSWASMKAAQESAMLRDQVQQMQAKFERMEANRRLEEQNRALQGSSAQSVVFGSGLTSGGNNGQQQSPSNMFAQLEQGLGTVNHPNAPQNIGGGALSAGNLAAMGLSPNQVAAITAAVGGSGGGNGLQQQQQQQQQQQGFGGIGGSMALDLTPGKIVSSGQSALRPEEMGGGAPPMAAMPTAGMSLQAQVQYLSANLQGVLGRLHAVENQALNAATNAAPGGDSMSDEHFQALRNFIKRHVTDVIKDYKRLPGTLEDLQHFMWAVVAHPEGMEYCERIPEYGDGTPRHVLPFGSVVRFTSPIIQRDGWSWAPMAKFVENSENPAEMATYYACVADGHRPMFDGSPLVFVWTGFFDHYPDRGEVKDAVQKFKTRYPTLFQDRTSGGGGGSQARTKAPAGPSKERLHLFDSLVDNNNGGGGANSLIDDMSEAGHGQGETLDGLLDD